MVNPVKPNNPPGTIIESSGENNIVKGLRVLTTLGLVLLVLVILYLVNNYFYQKGYKKAFELGVIKGKDERLIELRNALIQCGESGGNLILRPIPNGVNFSCGKIRINLETLPSLEECLGEEKQI